MKQAQQRRRKEQSPNGSGTCRASQFVGWWRPHLRAEWEALAWGGSWRECWLGLVRVVADRPGDLQVLAGDQQPVQTSALLPGTSGERMNGIARNGTTYPNTFTGGTLAVTNTIRDTLHAITNDLASLDDLLKKARRPLPDLEAATALVGLVKLRETAGKLLGKFRPIAEEAAQAQLFDEQPPNAAGGKKK